MTSPHRVHATDVRYAPPAPETATIPKARLAYLERVERAAVHELLMWEASLRHTRAWTAAAAQHKGWLREEKALGEGHDAARAALHAALAARPAGEERPGGD